MTVRKGIDWLQSKVWASIRESLTTPRQRPTVRLIVNEEYDGDEVLFVKGGTKLPVTRVGTKGTNWIELYEGPLMISINPVNGDKEGHLYPGDTVSV